MTLEAYKRATEICRKIRDLELLESYADDLEQNKTQFITLSEGWQNVWWHVIGKNHPDMDNELKQQYIGRVREFIKENKEKYLSQLEEL